MRHADLKNRIDALVAADRYREAERDLLTLIAAEPDCLPAYQKLGVTYLRLKDYQPAKRYLRQAARMMPTEPSAFDGLAETFALLDDVPMARQAGRRALVLKDASSPFLADPPRTPSPRAGGSRLIAFSLYGAQPRYCETAVMNVELASDLLPGWRCRFYVDTSVPPAVLRRLGAAGAQVVMVEGARLRLPGTMWRFLALEDPDAEAVICRDADSLLNARDAAWVGAWLESSRPFHIIRDFFSHTELMLAGLFGVRGGLLRGLEAQMHQWLAENQPVVRWTDQYFLRGNLWPLARDTALTHDPWFGYGSHVAPDTAMCGDPNAHVGANHSAGAMGINLDQPDGSVVQWSLVDTVETAVCSYVGIVRDRQVLVDIPRSYSERIRGGGLKVHWVVTSTGSDEHSRGVARVTEQLSK